MTNSHAIQRIRNTHSARPLNNAALRNEASSPVFFLSRRANKKALHTIAG